MQKFCNLSPSQSCNNNACIRIIYQFAPMQKPFLQTISPLSPKYTKSSFFRDLNSKPNNRKDVSLDAHRRQPNSLLSIYAQKLFERKASAEKQYKEAHHREWVPLNCKDNDLLLYTIQNKNNKNKRVESTINSVNNYTEQLRMTLLNEYKTRKQRELLKERRKFEKQKLQKDIAQKPQNLEVLNSSNPMLTKYSNKAFAFKTINLLYKAIIDNSFHKRKKEQFEVHANRFPIINRRDSPKKKQILRLSEQQEKANIETRRTFVTLHHHTHELNHKNVKKKHLVLKDNVDIFPWKSQEQQIDQN